MTVHFLFLLCRVIVSKILENPCPSSIDINAGSVQKEGESRFQLAEYNNSWLKGQSRNFYPLNSKTDNR